MTSRTLTAITMLAFAANYRRERPWGRSASTPPRSPRSDILAMAGALAVVARVIRREPSVTGSPGTWLPGLGLRLRRDLLSRLRLPGHGNRRAHPLRGGAADDDRLGSSHRRSPPSAPVGRCPRRSGGSRSTSCCQEQRPLPARRAAHVHLAPWGWTRSGPRKPAEPLIMTAGNFARVVGPHPGAGAIGALGWFADPIGVALAATSKPACRRVHSG